MPETNAAARAAEDQLAAQLPLPQIPLARLLKLRRDLSDWVAPRFACVPLTRDTLDSLVDELAQRLPRVARRTLFDATDWLLGTTQTEVQLRLHCWRLAGNYPQLRAGIVVLPWRAPGVLEWCPVQVARVAPAPPRNGQSRYRLDCRILAGRPAGLMVSHSFSLSHLYLVAETIGFTKLKGPRPLESPWQFVNMRFWALLDPQLSRDEQPGFSTTRGTASLLAFNRPILDIRFRDSAEGCQHKYEHPCHRCHVGYEHCAAATHRAGYEQIMCPTCHQPRWRDPDDPGEQCIACFRRELQHPGKPS